MRRGLQWVYGLCKQLLKQTWTWHELNASLWLGNKRFPIRGLDHTDFLPVWTAAPLQLSLNTVKAGEHAKKLWIQRKTNIPTGQIDWICCFLPCMAVCRTHERRLQRLWKDNWTECKPVLSLHSRTVSQVEERLHVPSACCLTGHQEETRGQQQQLWWGKDGQTEGLKLMCHVYFLHSQSFFSTAK